MSACAGGNRGDLHLRSAPGEGSGRWRRASCAIPLLSPTATQDEGAASRRARLGEHGALELPADNTWDTCETRVRFGPVAACVTRVVRMLSR